MSWWKIDYLGMSIPPPDPGLPGLESLVAKNGKKPDAKKLKPVKVGAVSLPIYHYGDGRWTTIYRETKGGKRITLSCKTEAEVRERAAKICLDIARGQISADRLTPDERLQAVSARNQLAEVGMTLDTVAREVAEAHRISGGAGILEAARFWARHHQGAHSQKPVEAVHAQMLDAKRDQGLSRRYWRELTMDLTRFCAAFEGQPITEIAPDEILKYLRTLKVQWRRRNKVQSLIVTLFAFAKANGHLPQDRDTAPEMVDKLRKPTDAPPPGVFTPEEMRSLLENVAKEWRPWIALGGFAGLRTAEIERLRWSDILWDDALVHIRDDVAKRTSRKIGDARYVPMTDNLLVWLEDWREATGDVCAKKRTDRLTGSLGKILPGGKWVHNGLRHSWISYRAAETANLPLVADEAGNSTEISRTAYRNPRMKRQALAWFGIYPKGKEPKNIIRANLG